MAETLSLLEKLFNPSSVAVFGSVKEGKIAHQIITQLVEGEFNRGIYAVNPKGESPAGFPEIPGVTGLIDIEDCVDTAVICAPAAFVSPVLEECGKKSIPTAIVITSGFGEAGNKQGELDVVRRAGELGIRLIGPNCAGIMNTGHNFYPSIEVRALPGNTAFVTQSGAVGGAVLAMAKQRGIGFSKFVSFGNRADLGENELISYLKDDPETDVVALYLESLQDGKAFMKIASAAAAKKPLLVIKAGRSSSGVRAASSHTGSMAGSDRVFDAMIGQTGAIRVEGIEEMLDLCYGFSTLPPIKGNRIAIVTNSGGPGILTADKAEEEGLEVRETEPAIQEKLKTFLPSHCAFANPVDLTVEGTGDTYRKALESMLDGGYDGAIAINVATPFLESDSLAEGIADAAESGDKPVAAVFMAGEIVSSGIEVLNSRNVSHFPTGERAATVLHRMRLYTRKNKRPPKTGISETRDPHLANPVLEPDAVTFLENEGFSFPRHRFISAASTDGQALCRKAAEELGFPMVMKVVSPEILHKSDAGGVTLDITDMENLESSYRHMETGFSSLDFKGVMLYQQVDAPLELIAGINRDPDFGPVILVGAGGIYTELLQDSSLRIAPFEIEDSEEMLSELKIKKLMDGYRGNPPLDCGAAAQLLTDLSRLALTYPAVKELDFNPVFVFEKGYVIGDTRILL